MGITMQAKPPLQAFSGHALPGRAEPLVKGLLFNGRNQNKAVILKSHIVV